MPFALARIFSVGVKFPLDSSKSGQWMVKDNPCTCVCVCVYVHMYIAMLTTQRSLRLVIPRVSAFSDWEWSRSTAALSEVASARITSGPPAVPCLSLRVTNRRWEAVTHCLSFLQGDGANRSSELPRAGLYMQSLCWRASSSRRGFEFTAVKACSTRAIATLLCCWSAV